MFAIEALGCETRPILGMRMISACCKMHELAAEGMTIVEDLGKKREPLIDVEAVYLITPTENSIRLLMNDFRLGMHMYRCAHIFFTESKFRVQC